MIDTLTEKCRACTLKHLSAALTALDDDDPLTSADFCGNLVHAANHFMRYSQELASQMRQLRRDSQDEYLRYTIDKETIKQRLKDLIVSVQTFVEPPEEPTKTAQPQVQSTPKSSGCSCRKGKK